jgi:pyridine nucleotide-disulfide oxidoreductase
VGRGRYDANPRGMLIGERWGMLTLLFSTPDEKPLGVHVIGDNACEPNAPGLVAMTLRATCSTFIDPCFNYPSLYDAMGRVSRGDVYRPCLRALARLPPTDVLLLLDGQPGHRGFRVVREPDSPHAVRGLEFPGGHQLGLGVGRDDGAVDCT